MMTTNMHNLTTLIKRLEAATSRLEDIASSTIELPRAVPALSQTVATPISDGPGPLADPSPPPSAPQGAQREALPPAVAAFDNFIDQTVGNFVDASKQLGGPVAEQALKILDGFKQQRRILLLASKAKKPDFGGTDFGELAKPIGEVSAAVDAIKESNSAPAFTNQVKALAELPLIFNWMMSEANPLRFVTDADETSQFWLMKVQKEYKGVDENQMAWVNTVKSLFTGLKAFIKENCTQGIEWNPAGQPLAEVLKDPSLSDAPSPAPAPAAGAPPPPPPPGPPPVLQIKEQNATPAAGSGLGAVFSELNRGADVTKGLRKVEKSEMTHKNPALRGASTVPDADPQSRSKHPAPGKKPKPESMRTKKPPKKELDGNKWLIENFENHSDPIEIEASISHSILISKCNHTTIIVKGKANAVTIENTQRLSLVVDSLVSTVDVVKSANFALQVLGTIPTVMLDQLDGATVYLSKTSMDTRIFSSKSAGINLNVIHGDDEDYKELPLASQICSYYDEAKDEVINEIVDHAG